MTRAAVTRLLIAAVLTMPTLIGATAGPSPQTVATPDASRLRTLFFQRDYDAAIAEGGQFAALGPEARAWVILSMARGGREKDAIAAAENMVAELPSNGWASLTTAGVRHYQTEHVEEAIKAGEKALALMPNHADAIWMRVITLTGDANRRDEAIALIDARKTEVRNPAQLLVAKAYAFYVQGAGRTRDEAKITAAFDTFAEARRADPANVDAAYLAGTYLSSMRRNDEAIPLLKTAASLTANSSVQQAYWRAVNTSTTIAPDAKLAEIQSSIDAFLAKNSHRSNALYGASSMYRDLKLTAKQVELEDTILQKFSDTIDAEWVLAYRWREVAPRELNAVPNPEYRKTMATYLARPKHYHEGLLGEAYQKMFFLLVTDKTTNPAELQRVADGMVKYETTNVHIVHASAPIAMADNKVLLDTAETIARNSPGVFVKKIESQREIYDGAGAFEKATNSMVALGYDALGWVLFVKDRTIDAEKQLLKSYELNHENRLNLYHLGRFYETTKDITKAEEFYVKGLSVSALGVNPSEAALKSLFEAKKTGGTFDAYLTEVRAADRERRRTKVMGERLAAPKVTPAFDLKTLGGKAVTLESLKGKVVAINFWGIWCGWCVHELPDFQKLHDQYKNDPDVVILTIDNDQNPADVPPWMKLKAYTFPVLLDNGFVAKAGITAFPTTWFLDRDGKTAFVKVGWSEKLLEEFSWRIEAIKK